MVAEKLYEVKEELKRLFLLKRVVPVIPLAGVKEKPRYAKIENYSDDVRVSEGALYVKITLNFTEDVPVEDNYELIGVDTSEMDEQAIKEANTGSHVFLKGTISILDAIEDVDIFINKD